VRHVRLAYGGVAAMPMRALKTEAALLGKVWNEETIRAVIPILRTEFAPISDVRGSAEFRRELIVNLFEKFFHQRAAGILPAESNLKLGLPAGRQQDVPPHESAHKHANGEAIYTDDFAARK